ncbi:hypothetical protein ACIP98_38500 [Streptomyces sp. NPDC088354]|uniref:hypothetical protein n=1 Tax=unclassified Streptomyces TaxID=2593676 RepID=UPI0029BE326B|nr:hypothetical protein [Streptomyces sp. MI02-7b]MDX3074929.1 hypothetical protein [Streptomyces sp. MI02-7b]
MNQPGVSIHQLRVVMAVLSLALFVQTAFWLLYDLVVRGLPGAWTMWTTGYVPGLSATSSLDLGLAALQLAAAAGAFLGTRGAGGLLVTACAVTLGFRLPAVWYFLLDSPADPWFGPLTGPSVNAVGGSALLAVVVALVLGALLLLARHMEYEAAAADAASGGGIRPVKVTAATSGLLLAVLNIFYIGRNTVTAFQVGPGVLGDLLVGRGTGRAVLGVSAPYQWACLTVLCGAGMLLAARRRPVATGFSSGLSLFMMPSAFTDLWAYTAATMSPTLVDTSQHLLEFVGSAAVVALTIGDVRRERRPDRPAVQAPEVPETEAPETPEAGSPARREVESEPAEA